MLTPKQEVLCNLIAAYIRGAGGTPNITTLAEIRGLAVGQL